MIETATLTTTVRLLRDKLVTATKMFITELQKAATKRQ